jgi:hypothetical protein
MQPGSQVQNQIVNFTAALTSKVSKHPALVELSCAILKSPCRFEVSLPFEVPESLPPPPPSPPFGLAGVVCSLHLTGNSKEPTPSACRLTRRSQES